MSRKWGKKQWYEYHKGKAAESGVQIYAASEKNALDTINKRISELQKEEKQLSATLTGWLGLRSIFVSNQTTLEISAIRNSLEELYLQRGKLYQASGNKINKAADRGISDYHVEREIKAEEEANAAKERRIRYLERSPAIRSAQSAIKEHLIAIVEVGEIVCYYCNVSLEPEEVHIEHKLPVARGGTNSRKNLALACATCNLRKGKKTESEFRHYLEQKK